MVSISDHPRIPPTTSTLTLANHFDHFMARFGVKRNHHRVDPGLYSLGNPTPDSPVFVTANYTLSFDALRSALTGQDGYILVLDTKGINVWCAAGKGTFGTDEVVNRIEATQLYEVVNHKTLILPQLGAPGVAAHEVKKRSGFRVKYGPIRASDLPVYLKDRKATHAMRLVQFPLWERVKLIPIELVFVWIPILVAGLLLKSPEVVAAILAGVILFPILLPWLPTSNFSTKGYILGGIVALPFALNAFYPNLEIATWQRLAWVTAYALTLPPITAYLALNFTGSSTFTSRTGVQREIFRYAPSMAWMFGIGIILYLALYVFRILGG
jgi:hypothetical protein